MPLPFSFATATEILFGRGQANSAPVRVAALGKRVLLVQGGNPTRSEALAQGLAAAGCAVERFAVTEEPDTAIIESGVSIARATGTEVVVALGGGAVIDAGKAIAALAPATRPMIDHLEVVGAGLPLDHPPLPFVALPTTAGTGAEVTRNAVITVKEHARKVSLRDVRMLPRIAIVDPALTDGCPRAITLASGLDAITQVIEPYVCTRANPLTDALCRDAIPRGLSALIRLMQAEDAQAMKRMMRLTARIRFETKSSEYIRCSTTLIRAVISASGMVARICFTMSSIGQPAQIAATSRKFSLPGRPVCSWMNDRSPKKTASSSLPVGSRTPLTTSSRPNIETRSPALRPRRVAIAFPARSWSAAPG